MIIANRVIHEWLKSQVWYYPYLRNLLDVNNSDVSRKLARDNKKYLRQRAFYFIMGGSGRYSISSSFIWENTPEGREFWETQNKALRDYTDKSSYYQDYDKVKSLNGKRPLWWM